MPKTVKKDRKKVHNMVETLKSGGTIQKVDSGYRTPKEPKPAPLPIPSPAERLQSDWDAEMEARQSPTFRYAGESLSAVDAARERAGDRASSARAQLERDNRVGKSGVIRGYRVGNVSADENESGIAKQRYDLASKRKEELDEYFNDRIFREDQKTRTDKINAIVSNAVQNQNFKDIARRGSFAGEPSFSDKTKSAVAYINNKTKREKTGFDDIDRDMMIKASGLTDFEAERYDTLTEDEKNIVRYYAALGDYGTISEYLKSKETILNARAQTKRNTDLKEFSEKHPIAGSAANIASVYGTLSPYLENAGQMVKNTVTGEYTPTDTNSEAFANAHASNATAEGVGNAAYNAARDTFGSETAGNVARDLSGIGLSIGQNVALLPLGNTGALAAMGASAAGSSTLDALERGATQQQAFVAGTASGIIEAATEKIPLDRIFKLAKTNPGGVKEVISSVLKQSGIEGLEESASNIAGNIADRVIMGDKSNYELLVAELVKQGISQQEAEKQAFTQLYVVDTLKSAAGGALSGGVMGAGASAVGMARGRSAHHTANRAINNAYNEMRENGMFGGNAKNVLDSAHDARVVDREINRNITYDNLEPETKSKNVHKVSNKEIAAEYAPKVDAIVNPLKERLGKIDADISMNKKAMLPGETKESIVGRLESERERVENRINDLEQKRNEFYKAAQIARKFGADLEIGAVRGMGEYKDGIITLNPYADNPVRKTFIHEFTHYIETSAMYDSLRNIAVRESEQETGKTSNELLDAITYEYNQRGVKLDPDGATRELVAMYCENNLFQNENAILSLARNDMNLFQRIRQWIDNAIVRLSGTQYEKDLLKVQKLYEKCARSIGEVNGAENAQYKILKDSGGNSFVDVPIWALDNTSINDVPKAIAEIVRTKFNGWVNANGQQIGINQKTAGEWVRSKDAQKLSRVDKTARNDKINAFGSADELLKASKDYIGEELKHVRKDNFKEFARGKVRFRVGANGYEADIIVGTTKNNIPILYDIVNLNQIKIAETPDTTLAAQSAADRRQSGSATNSISQTAENSNHLKQNISHQQNAQASEKSGAFSMSEDVKNNKTNAQYSFGLTPEQIKYFENSEVRDENGELKQVYHGTSSNFTIFDPDKTGRNYNDDKVGFFFTDDPNVAENAANDAVDNIGGQENIMPVYLNLEDPFVIRADNRYPSAVDFYDNNKEQITQAAEGFESDGIIVEGLDGKNLYVAFNSNQIKSVFNKNPTSNKDIRYSLGLTLGDLVEEHGSLPKGEKTSRDIEIPRKTDGKKNVRRFVRTVLESEHVPDEMVSDFEKAIVDGDFSYTPVSNEHAQRKAVKSIETMGYEDAYNAFKGQIAEGKITDQTIALGEHLLSAAAQNKDAEAAIDISTKLSQVLTTGGQIVQAAKILKRMTPEGRLYTATKTLEYVKRQYKDMLQKKKIDIEMPDDIAQQILSAKTEVEIQQAEDAFSDYVASKLPLTKADQIRSWRYLAMLANPTTHIRNFGGNALMRGVTKTKDVVKAGLEKMLIRDKNLRSAAVITDRAARDFAREQYKTAKDTMDIGEKYISSALRQKKRAFNNKFLDAIAKFNSALLEGEDNVFMQSGYVSAYAQKMKASGYTTEFLSQDTKEAKQARLECSNYAMQQAKEATYRDASAMADWINKAHKIRPEDKASVKVAKTAMNAALPFVRTPVNIARRGVEYSPAGLINAAADLVQAGRAKKSGDAETRARYVMKGIDDLAKWLTGSVLFGLGWFLAHIGAVRITGTGDEKDKEFQKLQGAQDYSMKIGDTYISIGWLAPTTIPLFMGANVCEQIASEDADVSWVGKFYNVAEAIMDPMVETTMLSSIDDILRSGAYADNKIGAVATQVASNYAGQFVPTMLSKIARTVDDTRRTTMASKDNILGKQIGRIVNQTINKVPGASMKLPAYVDRWGREQYTGTLPVRALNNFLNPAYSSKENITPVDTEIQRLVNATNDKGLYPKSASTYMKVNDKTYYFSPEEYAQFQKTMGQTAFSQLNSLFTRSDYKNMSDEDKRGCVNYIYDYARERAQQEFVNGRTEIKRDKPSFLSDVEGANKLKISTVNYVLYKQKFRNVDSEHGAEDTMKKLDKMLTPEQKAYFDKKEARNSEKIDFNADRKRRIIMNMEGISAKQKSYLDDTLVRELKDKIDYTDEDTFYYSQLSDKAKRKAVAVLSRWDWNMQRYFELYQEAGRQDLKADKIRVLQEAGLSTSDSYRFYNIALKAERKKS